MLRQARTGSERLVGSPLEGARTVVVACLAAVFFLSLAGCGAGVMARKLASSDVVVNIKSAPDANLNNPVAVDILLFFDRELESEVLKLPARQWMQQKAQFKLDHKLDVEYMLWELEPVPGRDIAGLELPLTVSGTGFVVFADYHTAGDHRVRTDPDASFDITLKRRLFTVEKVE